MKLLYIIGLTIFISNYCSAATNNHNNKYDPNIIYTSTQYMIDHDIELLQDEKKLMQFNKTINNAKSQTSILLGYEINGQISKKLKTNNILNISDFREIIDPIIQRNIGNLPENALEVQNINKSLTKFTLEALLNIVVQNKIKIKDSNKSENKCNIKCNNNINDSNSVNKNTVQDNSNINNNSANNSNDIKNINSVNNMNVKNNSNINNQKIANNSINKNKNNLNNNSNITNNNLNNKDKVNNKHNLNITKNKSNNISNTNNLLDKGNTSNKNTVNNNDNSMHNHNASNKNNNANNKNNMQNNNNVINITNCHLLLLNNETNYINSIFGRNYNNDIQELGIIKYKNKKCTFSIVVQQNEFYWNVNLS